MDAAAACAELRPHVAAYGKTGSSGLPFSEVGWLDGLVNLTEWMGATGFNYGGSFSKAESDVAFAALQLRDVTIGGGLNHSMFAQALTDLMDACDKAFP